MKLAQQLVKEIQRKPGKASVLALLFVVAIWFWGPLVAKWLGGGASSKQSASEGASAEGDGLGSVEETGLADVAPPVPAEGSSSGEIASGRRADWRQAARWIEADPRMRPSAARWSRNPFAPPVQALEDQTGETDSGETKPANTAATATAGIGLKLDGTLVGSRRRVAIISGKPYTVGDQVPAPTGVTFEVKQVEALRVVLAHGDKTLNLMLVGSGSSGDEGE
jgi:hypothetical protein